jgi:hypothetical protein
MLRTEAGEPTVHSRLWDRCAVLVAERPTPVRRVLVLASAEAAAEGWRRLVPAADVVHVPSDLQSGRPCRDAVEGDSKESWDVIFDARDAAFDERLSRCLALLSSLAPAGSYVAAQPLSEAAPRPEALTFVDAAGMIGHMLNATSPAADDGNRASSSAHGLAAGIGTAVERLVTRVEILPGGCIFHAAASPIYGRVCEPSPSAEDLVAAYGARARHPGWHADLTVDMLLQALESQRSKSKRLIEDTARLRKQLTFRDDQIALLQRHAKSLEMQFGRPKPPNSEDMSARLLASWLARRIRRAARYRIGAAVKRLTGGVQF